MARRILWLLVKVVVSVTLLWLVIREIDSAAFGRHWRVMSVSSFGIALVLLMLQGPTLALRWQVVLQSIGASLPLSRLVRASYVGLFCNQVLPTSIGGDAVRIWQAHRAGLDLRTAANSVFLERLSGLFVLTLIPAMVLPLVWDEIPSATIRLGAIILPALSGSGLAAIALFGLRPARLNRLPFVREFGLLCADLRLVMASGASVAQLFVLGAASHLQAIAAACALGYGLGLPVDPLLYVALITLSLLAAIVPISIAGWGVREGSMITLFTAAGGTAEGALALSVLFGIAMLAAALPGGAILLFGGAQRAGSRAK